jgi:hypothetical protein
MDLTSRMKLGIWLVDWKPASCFITCNCTIHNVWLTVDTINPVLMREELVFLLIICNISRNIVLHMIYCTAHQQWSSNIISCKSTVFSNDILEYGQWPQSSYCWPFFAHVHHHWLLATLGTPVQFLHYRPTRGLVLIRLQDHVTSL